MTAEIVVMNSVAIALAADSAVTVQNPYIGEGNQKIYNTSNKLFMLSKFDPVGIMIYGNADLLRVPWEVIIKMYRNNLAAKSFPTVKEYALDFISYLEAFFPEVEQVGHFFDNIAGFYYNILLQEINTKVDETIKENSKIEHQNVRKIVETTIKSHLEKLYERPKLPSLPDDFDQSVIQKYQPQIEQAINDVFEKLPISKVGIERLINIAGCIFSRDVFPPNISGVVMAGFGKNETFPALFAIAVDGVINGKLKYRVDHDTSIDPDRNAIIIPFAQREMVNTFIEGIDPSFNQLLDGYLAKVFESYPRALINNLSQSTEKEKQALLRTLSHESTGILKKLREDLKEYKEQVHINPILSAVGILPKDELAAMAESLVNLTSFKRRVSMEAETVGGPIDVAVISKGDGFVWIKRKHYFAPELNHHFFVNYFRDCL
ncbi:MAG: hypothetical protein WC837_10960 [Bellilinea sp.]